MFSYMHTFNWEGTIQIANTVLIRAKNNLVLNLLDNTHNPCIHFFHRERELILIINNCSLPGNGKVASRKCMLRVDDLPASTKHCI